MVRLAGAPLAVALPASRFCSLEIMTIKNIRPEHFRTGVGPAEARSLFKRSVEFVGLETFSYCNRKCWFCANSFIDRKTANLFLDEGILAMVLRDLAEIDFDRTINLSSYNEPLADPVILDHLRRVRREVPRAQLSLYSNGDYLNRDYLDRLHDAGLNELYLSLHTGDHEDLNDSKVERRLRYFRDRCGLDITMTRIEPGVRYKGRADYRGMYVQFYEPNMRTLGSNMGELIEDVETRYVRTCPCLEPLTHLTIDYTGFVVPCCRIRSDAKEHKPYVICDLREVPSIFDAYTHPNAVAWRRSLSSFGVKDHPCGTCDNAQVAGSWLNRWRFRKIERIANQP